MMMQLKHNTIRNDNVKHRMKHNNMNSLTEMVGSLILVSLVSKYHVVP